MARQPESAGNLRATMFAIGVGLIEAVPIFGYCCYLFLLDSFPLIKNKNFYLKDLSIKREGQ